MQQLAEFGHRQQEELLQRQKQLEQAHEHLVENSKTILEAQVFYLFTYSFKEKNNYLYLPRIMILSVSLQEAFESKQASMFVAIDKLFALHNAILLESRVMKAFFVYTISIFILYMFTSTKQTYIVRPRLYIGKFIYHN